MSASTRSRSWGCASRARARGFTLIELLVAVVAGMFVILAALLLSRGATRLFASENRLGTSQANLRLGLDRLRSDLERAGFMTTPSFRSDPNVCPNLASAPVPMFLQSVRYSNGKRPTLAQPPLPQNAVNNLFPDQIIVQGNFASSDAYPIRTPDAAGGVTTIFLQQGNGAIQRLLSSAGASGSVTAVLNATFPPGGVLRLTNRSGWSQFLIIAGTAIQGDGSVAINLAAAPALTTVASGAADPRCGVSGFCIGCTVNPVQIFGYSVQSLNGAEGGIYNWAYPNDIAADASKYDLVRTQYDASGAVIPRSETIVAEYVVDLAFAFSADTSLPPLTPGAWVEPLVTSFPFDDPRNDQYGGSVNGSPVPTPQRIRSVRYRMTTRSREPDRTAAINATQGPGLLRYQVGVGQFARARTIMGEVTLLNQQGIRW